MTLSFYTWTDFEKNCAYSRLYGGVNFPDSVANIREMALQMGRRSMEFVRYHVNLARQKTDEEDSEERKSEESSKEDYTIYSRDRSQSVRKDAKKKEINYRYLIMYDP